MPAIAMRKPLLALLCLAFALRAVAAVAVQYQLEHRWKRQFVIEGDANGYWELGRKIAAGEDYAIYDPPRYVLRMPGFPAVLAFGMTLADVLGLRSYTFLVTRLVLAACGTLACGLVFWLGSQLFDVRTGLIAAGITAVSPVMIGFSVLELSETAFAATILASLVAIAMLVKTPLDDAHRMRGVILAAVSGVAIAIACYMRPSWLLIAPGFAVLYALLSHRRLSAIVRGAVVVAGTFAALGPWAVRNYNVTGHLVFTTLWSGPSLYDGLNPHATGESDMRFFDEDRLSDPAIARMSEYEIDRHYAAKARDFVKQNPGRALELAAVKSWRYWKPWPSAAEIDHPLLSVAVASSYLPVLALGIVGLWMYRKHAWTCILTAGPILYFALLHSIFIGSLRYRIPAEYPLCVLAAAAVQRFWRAQPSA